MQERETVMDGSAMPGDVAQQATATSEPRRPRVVIVGAGFGGLSAAMRLARMCATPQTSQAMRPRSRSQPKSFFLIGFRNRMALAIDWLWCCLIYQRGTRLITGHDDM
jgi:hypothetical protein